MKTALVLLALFGFSFALPSVDWSKIRPKTAFVKPVNNFSQPVLPRVVGGREVTPHSRPYQAAIVIDGAHFCGGSLISNAVVLTAAHCIEGHAYFQIILGAHDVLDVEPTQIVITSTNIVVHEDYNPLLLNNDIGIIRFPNAIVFNENIESIPLASASDGSFVDSLAILSGWGRLSDQDNAISARLNEVDLTIMANFWCSRTYGTEIVIASTLCTSGVGGLGGCDGDSGGPLVANGVQVGVASFVANPGCQAGYPTGYARITSFRNWIAEKAGV